MKFTGCKHITGLMNPDPFHGGDADFDLNLCQADLYLTFEENNADEI